MVDQVPAGAIPEEEFQANQAQGIPPGAIPVEQFQSDQDKFGTGTEIAKTAVEQALSGATLGASKVFETKVLGVPPENIAAREATNPGTSILSNIGGTAGMILGTGGLGGLAKGVGTAAKIGVGALEGAGIGGINQVTDDWSQNKALDAQKIAASAGLGGLLGAAGAGIAEGIRAKFSPIIKVSPVVEGDAAAGAGSGGPGAPLLDSPPAYTGVKPTTYAEIAERVNKSKLKGEAVPLPAQSELDGAISRVEMENPVNPLQRDSLGSQEAREIYKTALETPNEVAPVLQRHEALQKGELVSKMGETIKNVSPGVEPIADAYKGGQQAIEAFTDQYQAEKAALKPVFEGLKGLPVQGDLLPAAVIKMTDAVPGVAGMFDTAGEAIKIKPYSSAWGIDKATYNAVKEATESLSGADNSMESLWNVRKGLDQHIDVLAQGQAPAEIRALKSALMDLMQNSSGNPEIRESFKRYAINEQQRAVIEKSFGASVGAPEFGQISKVKPEMIGDKIFGNTATVEAAKNILPPEKFNQILANWLTEAQTAATDKGTFSSNKFASFLRRNQDALNIAFKDKPEQLQRLHDLGTIMRILPDSPSVNPSGTAKTVLRMIGDTNVHGITYPGMIAAIGKKALTGIQDKIKMNQLNHALSGQALQNAQSQALKQHALKTSKLIENGVKAMMSGSASESRKAQ